MGFEEDSSIDVSGTLLLSALTSLCLLFAHAFLWTIVEWVTPLMITPVMLGAWFIFGVGLFAALLTAFLCRKQGRAAFRPLLLSVGAGALALFVPWTNVALELDFRLHRSDRERIVHALERGALPVDSSSSVLKLPAGEPELSAGGNQVLWQDHDGKKFVFFFTYRGVLDNYSGFLHVPAGADPAQFSDLGEADSTQFVRYSEQWYFAANALHN